MPGGPAALLVNSPAYAALTLTGMGLLSGAGRCQRDAGDHQRASRRPRHAFAATINWGDGSSSAGTVTGSGSRYQIAGQHSYSRSGSHVITVTLTDRYDGVTLAQTRP